MLLGCSESRDAHKNTQLNRVTMSHEPETEICYGAVRMNRLAPASIVKLIVAVI